MSRRNIATYLWVSSARSRQEKREEKLTKQKVIGVMIQAL